MRIAQEGDHYYNDASWNVVYVDSHDYCPGPNDGVRFNGGTAQWAENLSLMFTFRGIPCIYYGSEVEFQKGKTIDKGPQMALANSGRAYFGAYLEGDVTASDFGTFTASGNVAKTLDAISPSISYVLTRYVPLYPLSARASIHGTAARPTAAMPSNVPTRTLTLSSLSMAAQHSPTYPQALMSTL